MTRDMIGVHDPEEESTAEVREARASEYGDAFPRLARSFTWQEAVALLKAILRASEDDGTLYQLTDYHWLLLYESLPPTDSSPPPRAAKASPS